MTCSDRRRPLALLGVLLALPIASAGCEEEPVPSEIVLVVDTHLRAPDEIDRIVIEATGPAGSSRTLDATLVGGDALELPLTLGIVAGGPRLDGLQVVASAFSADFERSRQLVRTGFVRNQRRLLHVVLWPACQAVSCPDQHCNADGSCSPAEITGTLPVFEGIPARVGDPCIPADDRVASSVGCNGPPPGPQPFNNAGSECPVASALTPCADGSLCLASFDGLTAACFFECAGTDEYVARSDCPPGARCFTERGQTVGLCYTDCRVNEDCSTRFCDFEGSCLPAPPGDAGVMLPDAGIP